MHLAGLIPSLVMTWMQICVLAAIGVALSTRLPLVANLPTVILIYIAGNLTRFLLPLRDGAASDAGPIVKAFSYVIGSVLPFLMTFDIRDRALLTPIAVPGTRFADYTNTTSLASIWIDVGLAGVYAITFGGAALLLGLILFRNRELGGAEG